VASGRTSRKITVDVKGEILESEEHHQLPWWTSSNSFASEVTRVAREVGTEGKLGAPRRGAGVAGHLEGPHRYGNIHGIELEGQVPPTSPRLRPPCRGDLSKKITVGRARRDPVLKKRSNTMSEQFALVRRPRGDACVAREFGTDGPYRRRHVGPGWRHVKDPHEQRQLHGRNLTTQVQKHAEVTTDGRARRFFRKITGDVGRISSSRTP